MSGSEWGGPPPPVCCGRFRFYARCGAGVFGAVFFCNRLSGRPYMACLLLLCSGVRGLRRSMLDSGWAVGADMVVSQRIKKIK